MKALMLLLTVMSAVALTTPARAHEKAAAAPVSQAPQDPAMKDVTATVERFSAALKSGDMATVGRLLDEKALILESGGAERSRDEYLGHHAVSDAAFLGNANIQTLRRSGGVRGDLAWIGSESEIRTGSGSEAKTLLSTETMVLQRAADGWRIVHIHWSSRPKR